MTSLSCVTLPRHSPRRDQFRQSLAEVLGDVSTVSDPLRSRLRDKSFARNTSLQQVETEEEPPSVVILMVYRASNARIVRKLLSQIDSNADVRLWALDEIVPELADRTLGCGPGTRFSLINGLYSAKTIKEDSWVAISDDDIFFSKGGLTRTIMMAKRAGFSLAQPGQSILGWWTDTFSISRPMVRARNTNVVAQGPLIIADSEFSKLILPLPEGSDMGWGIEAEWYRLSEARFRIGIIDECRVVHCGEVAHSYATEPEVERMQKRLSDSKIDDIWQLRSVNKYWFTWQPTPPWVRD